MSKRNNRPITTIAVVMFASLFLCSFSLRESAYGSREGGLTGGGELSGPGGSPGSTPNNPSRPIASGETGYSSGPGPVGPHGPYSQVT